MRGEPSVAIAGSVDKRSGAYRPGHDVAEQSRDTARSVRWVTAQWDLAGQGDGGRFVAAGYPADANPLGTYTWTFADGRATIELSADDGSSAYCEADMSLQDGHVKFDYDPAGGDCGDLDEVVAWELADDGLHLFLISTGSP